MNEEIDFALQSQQILDRFMTNIFKATIISELKKEYISSSFSGLESTFADIHKNIGVENIAKDQAIVMIVSSFEAFIKDFFKLMILKEDILKTALRECEQLKIKPKYIVDILNKKSSWANLIIDEENLSFQSFGSLCKISKMLGFSFEDIVEDAAKELNNFIKYESKDKVTLTATGYQILKIYLNLDIQSFMKV